MSLIDRDWHQTYRIVTSPLRLAPDFIIAGEAKCGTTSLYRYLVAHPDVLPADRKEPYNFIDYPDSMAMCRSHYPFVATCWWRRRFLRRDCVTGEASAEYFSRRYVAEKIAEKLPDVRIIILLRDPVQRALSDWNMLKDAGVLTGSFEDIVDKSIRWLSDNDLRPILMDAGQVEHSPIRLVLRGIYVDNLQRWMKHFDRNHLRIYSSEHFFNNTAEVTGDIFRFIEVGPYQHSDSRRYREGKYSTGEHATALRKLSEFYAPFNEELFTLLGRRLPWDEANSRS